METSKHFQVFLVNDYQSPDKVFPQLLQLVRVLTNNVFKIVHIQLINRANTWLTAKEIWVLHIVFTSWQQVLQASDISLVEFHLWYLMVVKLSILLNNYTSRNKIDTVSLILVGGDELTRAEHLFLSVILKCFFQLVRVEHCWKLWDMLDPAFLVKKLDFRVVSLEEEDLCIDLWN